MGPVREWAILGFSVVAFILLLKLGATYLPDNNFLGALKRVIASI